MKFKDLFSNHFVATKNRGAITDEKTTLNDFIVKMHEEDYEFIKEVNKTRTIFDPKVKQELIDTIMVRINLLTFYDIDFKEELTINTNKQIDRHISTV